MTFCPHSENSANKNSSSFSHPLAKNMDPKSDLTALRSTYFLFQISDSEDVNLNTKSPTLDG